MHFNNYYQPTSLEDAYRKLKENEKNALIAGGLWMKKMDGNYETLIDLSSLGLNEIKEDEKYVRVGPMVSLREFEVSPLIKSLNDGVLSFAVSEVMGPAFRNQATIGGSIFGRYPFSDVIAGLLTLDVTLKLYPEGEMSLEDYLNLRGKPDFIIKEILIKKEKAKSFFKKVKTTALDFPLLNIAVSKRNGELYIAVGSRPMVAALAHKAMEAYKAGKSALEVATIASEELSFASSNNISKEYRLDLCKVYVARGIKEVE